MKERPILMSAPMVRAILDGRKTQTRRIVKERPPYIYVNEGRLLRDDGLGEYNDYFPYGILGDRLWVRETCLIWKGGAEEEIIYQEDLEFEGCKRDAIKLKKQGYPKNGIGIWKATPSIHMPRWASRITLEITNIRVERLQDISVEDAMAEGITHHAMDDPRVEYQWLWEDINGKGSWDLNPWVFAISFKRVQP